MSYQMKQNGDKIARFLSKEQLQYLLTGFILEVNLKNKS